MMTRAEREKWKRIRNTLTPAFSGLKMKQMMPLLNSCCDTLMRKLNKVADKEQSVDMFKYVENECKAINQSIILFTAQPQERILGGRGVQGWHPPKVKLSSSYIRICF